jgi:hypothetical protein
MRYEGGQTTTLCDIRPGSHFHVEMNTSWNRSSLKAPEQESSAPQPHPSSPSLPKLPQSSTQTTSPYPVFTKLSAHSILFSREIKRTYPRLVITLPSSTTLSSLYSHPLPLISSFTLGWLVTLTFPVPCFSSAATSAVVPAHIAVTHLPFFV